MTPLPHEYHVAEKKLRMAALAYVGATTTSPPLQKEAEAELVRAAFSLVVIFEKECHKYLCTHRGCPK